ncbi:MAG TPA: hypothetical protein DEP76_08955 [Alteromonas sp.]|nr:hypothetical protein [Alteromonas sp.]HCB17157.1 hypothetical protein [Alteromonas sp.]|tara:strand:- start:2114 stop:3778 length:1665 start_codon:yes stop_codon:yes gene_type:complete
MKKTSISLSTVILLSTLLISACNDESALQNSAQDTDYPYSEGDDIPALAYMEHNEVYNPESVIPPQCYTKTNGKNNPCYACHQSYDKSENRPNQMGDGTLQGNYEFSDVGLTNSWKNLFVDRRELIADISDKAILDYIGEDNYTASTENGLPAEMQIKQLSYPDEAFGEHGIANDGSGWVAYNYKPFPSTFWPTNGSTGDAMIRLPAAFQLRQGEYSEDVYLANLTLLEMALKDVDTLAVPPLNEQTIGMDLNGDGALSEAVTHIQRQSHYVGDASSIELSYQLYPQGTELLHTVRYIGVDDEGQIYNAPRMKEVRYMQKALFRSKESLASAYYAEAKDKAFEKLPQTRYLGEEKGIDNGFGWTLNAYIEDKQGQLRPQHEQELAFCNGCHKTVGSTFDQTFSFARKVPGAKGWGYINLHEIDDVPNINEQEGEFLTYMKRVGGGDEFRQNAEMLARWFNAEGKLNEAKVKQANSVYELITPSPERALALNKAYQTIVKEQSYLFGRDATITEATNVLSEIDVEQPPLLPEHRYHWDMRLDWFAGNESDVANNR